MYIDVIYKNFISEFLKNIRSHKYSSNWISHNHDSSTLQKSSSDSEIPEWYTGLHKIY